MGPSEVNHPGTGVAAAPGGRRPAALLAGTLLAGTLGVFLLAGGALLARPGGGEWKAAVLTSRPFVVCGVITLGCLAVLVLIGGAMWRAGAPARARRRGKAPRGDAPRPGGSQDGTAMVEFAMVLPIALMLVLIMTQSTLLMGGNLCVHYASFCAARSAVVNVPRNFPPDEPWNVVADAGSSGKLRRMHLAAVWALLPVSCSNPRAPAQSAALLEQGLEHFFSSAGMGTPGWVHRNLGQRLCHADQHTQVHLAPPANRAQYAPQEDLRVDLRHEFYLSVPYAAYIFSRLARDGVRMGFGAGEYGTVIRATCTLSNEGDQDYVDVETFPQTRQRN